MAALPPLLPRVRRENPVAFAPELGRCARVSLAWWDGREPVFVDVGGGTQRTIVIVWATVDAAALRLDVRAIRDGRGMQVLPWDVTAETRRALDELSEDWPLDEHDVYVSGLEPRVRVTPTVRSLRRLSDQNELDQQVVRMVDLWCRQRRCA